MRSTVVVTGSGVGIGRGLCISFAKLGATVVALDIDGEANEATSAEVESVGGTCHRYTCDIGDKAMVNDVFGDLATRVDRLDVLVNNAAVFNNTTLLGGDWETQTAAFDRAMGAGVTGAFYCTAAAAPLLLAAGESNIINVLTDHVKAGHMLTGSPATGYDCAKFSLWRLTESWAVELKEHGVRVNGLCFGATDTPMLRSVAPKMAAKAMVVDDVCQAVHNVLDQGPHGATGESYEFGMGKTPLEVSREQIQAIR